MTSSSASSESSGAASSSAQRARNSTDEPRHMDAIATADAFLHALWRPGDVRELRLLKIRRGYAQSGYFDDPSKLVAAAARFDGLANAYVTLNPVNPELLARAVNRVVQGGPATADVDVVERRWVLVDIDPKRPAGISATAEEVRHAETAAHSIRDHLCSLGWPSPVLGFSGNGFAELYQVRLPNDAASTSIVAAFIRYLATRFDSEDVVIDTTVTNPSRLTCLLGTLKLKGDSTADRPHRRSALVDLPGNLEVVPVELLTALAETSRERMRGDDHRGWVRARLDAAGVAYHEHPPDAAGIVWFGLEQCPFHPRDGTAWQCGVGEAPDGRGVGKCFHSRGSDMGWSDFRDAIGLRDATDAASEPRIWSLSSLRSQREWPAPPDDAAFDGFAGELVDMSDPHTEADRVAVLAQHLVAFGNAIGSSPHAMVGATRHGTNTYVALVGKTSKARKGDSERPVRVIYGLAAPEWAGHRIVSGVGSGEVLIWAVRDAVEKVGANADVVTIDQGEHDKRLLVFEPELVRILRVANRTGSILSAVLRDAWDRGDLRTMAKSSSARATAAHVSVVAHTTLEELRRELTDVEMANGFANRFIWLAVQRSKELPEPEPFEGNAVLEAGEELRTRIAFASTVSRVERDPEARELWASEYHDLSADRPGLVGAILARAEAQVLRLSLIYALIDRSDVIRARHQRGAFALWRYAESSVEYIFGNATGDPIADAIMRALKATDATEGLSRTQIRDLFGRHELSARIDAALGRLLAEGRARTYTRQTGGRPVEMWAVA